MSRITQDWRKMLLADVIVSVCLWGGSIVAGQSTYAPCTHMSTIQPDDNPWYGSDSPTQQCDAWGADQPVHATLVSLLRFASIGVILVTLAAIPMLRRPDDQPLPPAA